MRKFIPEELKDLPLMKELSQVVEASRERASVISDEPNMDLYLYSGSLIGNQVHIAINEFLNMIQATMDLDDRMYIYNRLIRLKSTSVILSEIENYTPITFNREIDPLTGLPNTFYEPRLLKLTIESLELDSIRYDFTEVILAMFDSLLYFIESDISIEDLIINIKLRLGEVIKSYGFRSYQSITTKYFGQ